MVVQNLQITLCAIVLCTNYKSAQAVLTGWSTGSGFHLAIFRVPLYLRSSWCCISIFFCHILTLPFSELSLVGLALDLVD